MKIISGILAAVFCFIGMVLIFVIALPLVGWSKSKYLFKRVAR